LEKFVIVIVIVIGIVIVIVKNVIVIAIVKPFGCEFWGNTGQVPSVLPD